jgi:hypothetical protein
LKAIGDSVVVNSRSQSAAANQSLAVESAAVCDQTKFMGR